MSEREQDELLRGELDLDAWPVEEPPPDFAEKVLARVRAEAPRPAESTERPADAPGGRPEARRARRWGTAGGAVAALALAAAIAVRVSGPPPRGEAIVGERTEISIGSRARAVLEPGARVSWDGDDVSQAKGDVFYRVEPGARFRVHTPAGDVEVKGTCFTVKVRGEDMQKRDIKAGAVGAGIAALAFVAVYEGKVAVSHASERVDLAAGETAQVGAEGAKKTGDLAAGQRSFDEKAPEEPLAKANENLVDQVREYRERLELIAKQKSAMEDKLAETQKRFEAAQSDGAAPRTRSEYDLDQNDWAELAKSGEIKYQTPCLQPDGWSPNLEAQNKLGLAPQDAAPIKAASRASYERVWSVLRPLCVQALGSELNVDKIGPTTCVHLVFDVGFKLDPGATAEAQTQVAEIRAGLRAEPPADKQHPVMKMMLMLTTENHRFESDLAKTFGPEEAHRLAWAEGTCRLGNRWGGRVKRGDEKK